MKRRSPSKLIDHPISWPLLGHAIPFLRDRLGFLEQCAALAESQNKKIALLQLGEPTLLLLDAVDIEHILLRNSRNYEKTPRLRTQRGQIFSGDSLLTTTTKKHLVRRRTLQPIFRRGYIHSFGQRILDNTANTLSTWPVNTILNLNKYLLKLTQANIAQLVFADLSTKEQRHLADAVRARKRFLQISFQSLLPYPEYWPIKTTRDFQQGQALISRTIYSGITKRATGEESSQDLLTMLLQMQSENGDFLSTKQIHDEAMTLLITGFETVGEALTWSIYLLAQHREITQKLRYEIHRILGDRTPKVEDLQNLKCVENVIQESMRLFPPTWLFVRIAANCDVLPSGASVTAGMKIYLCPWIVQRRAEYFADASRFEPNHFSDEAKRKRPRFAHFPFGGGPRRCIGEPLALMESVLVLTMLLQKFDFELVQNNVKPTPGMTLHPQGGLHVVLRNRT